MHRANMMMGCDPPDDTERIEAARKLGHDLYRHSHFMPQPEWDVFVLEGFHSAEARHVSRRNGDRFVRKWLQLRCSALRRKRIVDEHVTPALLQEIDVVDCPILRHPLTHAEHSDSDWSVDRINNDGAYAARNLAVISTLANRAKSNHAFATVHARARLSHDVDGLSPVQWMRLAALMVGPCFVEAPASAPILPLLAPLPVSTVRSATQMIQHVLTLRTRSASDKNLMIKQFTRLCSNSHSRAHAIKVIELIHIALKTTPVAWDVWMSPLVMQTFLAWRASLPGYVWAAMGETAAELAGGRRVHREAVDTWHLRSGGRFAENWRR